MLVALVVVAPAVVYRVAPDRDSPRFEWAGPGAIVAAVLWLVGSIVFSLRGGEPMPRGSRHARGADEVADPPDESR